MFKKSISLILIMCMVFGITCVYSAAVQGGEIGENLSWELSTIGRLTISGTGDTIPDYSSENPAPWAQYAAQVKTLSFPGTLRHIGAYAFDGCAQLKEIDLGKIESIGAYSFSMCGFEAIELPYSLKEVAPYAFTQCFFLEKVIFHEIEYGGLGVQKKEGVSEIGECAFSDCPTLATLNSYLNDGAIVNCLPSTLACIGKEAFSGCEALRGVNFADSGKAVTALGEGCFTGCTSLRSITLPVGIGSVPKDCFMSTGLQSVKLPANITAVGEDAFAFCEDLSTIDVYSNDCTFYDGENTTPDTAKLRVEYAAKKAISYASAYQKPYEVLCVGRGGHSFGTSTVSKKASALTQGIITRRCTTKSCGYQVSTVIPKVKNVKLTKTAFYFTGKKICPTVAGVLITDESGAVIPTSDYTVTCQTKGIEVGKHSVKIAFKASSKYTGSFVRYYTIVLKGTAVKTVDSGKGVLRVNWTKQTVGTNGYQVRICKKSDFKSGVILKTVRNPKAVSLTIKGLSRKTGYYIQIRTFRTIGKNKYVFSAWSKSFGRKTK